MSGQFSSRIMALVILLLIPLAFYFFYKRKIDAIPHHAAAIPVYFSAPSFSYPTQSGDILNNDSLKGKLYVADFIFTSCQSVCPNLSKVMAQVQQNFIADDRVKLVSFSIDPARDSMQALRDYAARYGAVNHKWYFLQGDTATTWKTVEQGFKVSVGYARDSTSSAGYSFTHTSDLLLVDEQGRVRGIYNGVDSTEVDSMYNAIGLLLAAKTL